jgi:SAM-dependent methyltransferase
MPAGYTMRLDAEAIARLNTMAEAARGFEAPAWDEADITDGASVLDVGCGTGAVLAEFAARVGAAGHAVGIDESPDAIETCRAYLADRGQGHATAMIADAFENELKSGTFDAAHLRLVLIHHGPPSRSSSQPSPIWSVPAATSSSPTSTRRAAG